MKSTSCFVLVISIFCLGAMAGPAPLPFLNQPLIPASIAPGSGAFTLTVTGTGFIPGAVVQWNHSARGTTFVSNTKLQAEISVGDVATATTALITVANPGRSWSNTVYFPVRQASATVSGKRDLSFAPKGNTLAVGDFNNDGKLDVANTFGAQLNVYLGNGDGTFQAPMVTALSTPVKYLLPGNFDTDGNLDILAKGSDFSVEVLRGAGNGTFSESRLTPYGGYALAFATGDFNHDGKLDFVHTEPEGLGGFDIFSYLFQANGTFKETWENSPICPPTVPAVGDLNNDGQLDFVSNSEVYLGVGDGTFTTVSNLSADDNFSTALADVNGDGILDSIGDRGSVALGDGSGAFTQISDLIMPGGNVAMGDMNGDGILDMVLRTVASDGVTQNIQVLLGNGGGTFQSPLVLPGGSYSSKFQLDQLQLGDFNGDGKLDVIVGGKALFLLLQN